MNLPSDFARREIEAQGFCLLKNALDAAAVARLTDQCSAAFAAENAAELTRSRQGHVYAARNVIDLVRNSKTVWRSGLLAETLLAVLGDQLGLVRALFLDKPPERTWSLPWHKDATIAVADNSRASNHFSHPTNKAGVPHVIACDAILQQMLTLRIHLDDVDDENGPLKVIPQSHFSKDSIGLGADAAVTIHAKAGDVLAMRPLIDHASGSSKLGATRHRRILHLEFAAMATLPDGYAWWQFFAMK